MALYIHRNLVSKAHHGSVQSQLSTLSKECHVTTCTVCYWVYADFLFDFGFSLVFTVSSGPLLLNAVLILVEEPIPTYYSENLVHTSHSLLSCCDESLCTLSLYYKIWSFQRVLKKLTSCKVFGNAK